MFFQEKFDLFLSLSLYFLHEFLIIFQQLFSLCVNQIHFLAYNKMLLTLRVGICLFFLDIENFLSAGVQSWFFGNNPCNFLILSWSKSLSFTSICNFLIKIWFTLQNVQILVEYFLQFVQTLGILSLLVLLIDIWEFLQLSDSPLANFILESFSYRSLTVILLKFLNIIFVNRNLPWRSCDFILTDWRTSNSI